MTQEAEKICEELDSAIFSSDLFLKVENFGPLVNYLKRWKKRIGEIKVNDLILPDNVDLTDESIPILDQGQLGSSASFAVNTALQFHKK